MSGCTRFAHVKTLDGKVVESHLFKDLSRYLPSRELTKEYYAVGTDKEFLDRVRDRAKFDENGEITFASLRKLAKINIAKEELINALNKQIKAGIYDYNEAIARVLSFNRNSGFKDEFMATIKSTNEGKYELSIVPRTNKQEKALFKEVKKRSLQDRLIYHLKKAGIDVEFLNDPTKFNGRYSTVNAELNAEGLYQLIQIVEGENVTETMAEGAGHFVIGALNKSPLVSRLLYALTPEVRASILNGLYDDARTLAGVLVGKALINEADTKNTWQRLASRIANMAKRIFSYFKKNNVGYRATLEAEEMARRLVTEFMDRDFNKTVNDVINNKETIYNIPVTTNTEIYKRTVNKLNAAVQDLSSIVNNKFTDQLKALTSTIEVKGRRIVNTNTHFSDTIALSGIAEALQDISGYLGEGQKIDQLLNSINYSTTLDYFESIIDNGRALRLAHTFLTMSLLLELIISLAIGELIGDISAVPIMNNEDEVVYINLHTVLNELKTANATIMAKLYKKESEFFCKFCEETLGRKYVDRSARVLFKWSKKWFLDFVKAGQQSVLENIKNLESDITLYERFIGSMSNNSDLIGLIVDVAVKRANKIADDETNIVQDKLRVLEARFRKLGIKTEDLYEKDVDGNYTGYFISDLKWSEWEEAFTTLKRDEWKKFVEATPDFHQMSDIEKGVRWRSFFKTKRKEFHLKNSIFDKEKNCYIPNSKYENKSFKSFLDAHEGLEEWYNDYMTLKESLDAKLPSKSTMLTRAPLFKGKFTNRIKNHTYVGTGKIKSTGKAVRSQVLDIFCESSEDVDYGSDQTYNSEEEELSGDKIVYEKEKLNRLPLFGINKLLDMTELSTDIFQATLSYAGMVNSYAALENIVDVLEVGKDTLKRRIIKNKKRLVGGKIARFESTENELAERTGSYSRAYNRYLKFLDKQVYSISMPKHSFTAYKHKSGDEIIKRDVILEKIASYANGMAGKYFLGGNVAGATVNVLTGVNELFKEAFSGEHFTMSDFMWANKYYWNNVISSYTHGQIGKDVKNNKLSLLIRRFNILGDNKSKLREWQHDRNNWTRLSHVLGETIMFPYKSGDHYMSSLSYLMMARKTMLYDSNGNKISLLNALEEIDLTYKEDGKDVKVGTTVNYTLNYYTEKEGKAKYDLIDSILAQIDNVLLTGTPLNLNTLLQEYVDNNGYTTSDLSKLKDKLELDLNKLKWGVSNESSFMDTCREINIRLHGIYNNQDKTAAHQNIFANMFLAMKGYALGMSERRFGANKYNVALGHDVEGSFNTALKVFLSTFTERGSVGLTFNALLLPMTKKSQALLYAAGFSANQVANLKRNFADYALITLLTMLCWLTGKRKDDDDDDDDFWLGMSYYFINRLYRELAAFNTPQGWYWEKNSLLDLTPAGVAAFVDVSNTAYLLAGGAITDEDNETFYYQLSGKGYEQYDSKGVNKLLRKTPYVRTYFQFEPGGYAASAAYEYGSRVKSR